MHPRTFLSFWHVEMSNFPVGTFRRRALSTTEARCMVNAARASGTLVCVAKEDLAAPYCDDERESHRQLCAALRAHADIEIHLRDFFGPDCANPLCAARIGEERRLLVVDCHYAFDRNTFPDTAAAYASNSGESHQARARRLMKEAIRMKIVPDSIKFYSFEQGEPAM
jgi:hypothetical protein